MTFKLGLTGSIGMGKSTTAQMFADLDCAIWDADAAVHRLYSVGGAAVMEMCKAFPKSVAEGSVDRSVLRKIISEDPTALLRIERIVHPLLAWDRAAFMTTVESDIIVYDIPLLFETGGDIAMDATVCVQTSDDIQQKRVLNRGTMTIEQFSMIRAKQMPSDDKCRRADYVVETDTLVHARTQVEKIVADIRTGLASA